ncbi:1,4-dihydroxy-2-naphthoate octaprenyltransferase [Bacteroidales bacterium]
MAKMQSWVKAARLRTLPLALSSVALGAIIAAKEPSFNRNAALMAGLTTLLLQILSNFANDLGDTHSGIDNEARVGPKRTVQLGEISRKEMKVAVAVTALLSLLSGLWLLFGLAQLSLTQILLFLAFGLAAIAAAINYTIGKNPYGYYGMGDLFVFLFFGLLAVAGTFYVSTGSIKTEVFLPAVAMGMWSTGVLNLNNMRDHENDRITGKHTLVVKMGYQRAKIYHAFLVLLPFALMAVFLLIIEAKWISWTFFVTLALFVSDLIRVTCEKTPARLDPFLKRLALFTMLAVLIFGFTFSI